MSTEEHSHCEELLSDTLKPQPKGKLEFSENVASAYEITTGILEGPGRLIMIINFYSIHVMLHWISR